MSSENKNGPNSTGCQGPTGHSPALVRLFLVGLRPRRARLRFTGQNKYRTGRSIPGRARNRQERTTVASALPAGRGPRQTRSQSECPRGLGVGWPSVILIETASVCETVAKNTPCRATLARSAAGFGRRIHEGMDRGAAAEKRTARTTSQQNDRDQQVQRPVPQQDASNRQITKNKPYGTSARTVRAKIRQEALDMRGSFRDGDTHLIIDSLWRN